MLVNKSQEWRRSEQIVEVGAGGLDRIEAARAKVILRGI